MAVAHSIKKQRPADTAQISEAERQVRRDLAAAYRLAYRHGWDDLIYTHISARVPGTHDAFLVNAFGLCFEEITASNLVKIDIDGTIIGESEYPVNAAGFVIHGAIHKAVPEIMCVMHLHTQAGIAVSAMEDGLLPLSQHAMRFHGRIGYHEFEGIALSADEEKRLVGDLGRHRVMILRNHGLLTCGETVAEAFVYMYYLEMACKIQIAAMAAQRLHLPTPKIPDLTASQFAEDADPPGSREWPAMLRRLDRECPEYRN
ncbi:MAG TPA: class II aldolase/adducin family protein [Burkholderiaceae bacterium]|nr:class II aldolase/adducin family protein [Burkholderiaceae bacterium]